MDMIKNHVIIFSIVLGMYMSSCDDSLNPYSKGFERVDIELSSLEKDMALSQYEFPVNLLSSAIETQNSGNVMVSPLSASMVLGMLANSIDPEDREEILKVINVKNGDLETYDSFMQKLNSKLPNIDKNTLFQMSNGFWLVEKANLSERYLNVLNSSYLSEIKRFKNFGQSTVNEINGWVKEKTNGGISRILENKDASLDLNTIWLNALYFKGNWRQKFDKSRTKKEPFYPNYPDKSVSPNVDMMYGNDFRYSYYLFKENSYDYDDAIATVMLPYGNESYIFTAVLPSPNNPDLQSTLQSLDSEYWAKIDEICSYKRDKPGDVIVKMPKINNENKNNLIPILMNMGLTNIFDPFEGVSMNENLELGSQYISLFRQSVVLDLDEEGTEIKVATVAGGGDLLAGPPEIIEFNRPFLYFVRERSTGAVLLAGVYREV